MRFALCALACFAVHVAAVSAQSRTGSLEYTREQASTSTHDVPGTWTIDRFVAMWSRVDVGGGNVEVEHQKRGGFDDVTFRTLWYWRNGDWTFSADGAVTPHANFLCRAAGGGEVSYRAVGTLVASGAYHFRQFPLVNIHQLEPALTWYRSSGEAQARVYITHNETLGRTSTGILLRASYDVSPRVRVGGGISIGDRIFDIEPLVIGAASGRLAYGETRLGFTDRDFVLAVVTVAHENPDFDYLAAALGYRRTF